MIPFILLVAQFLHSDNAYALPREYVKRVIDGDSIVLGSGEHVRMLGYNSVERAHKDYYKQGKYLSDLILRTNIVIHRTGKDRYKRTLATIYLGNTCINKIMRKYLKRTTRVYNKYDKLTTKKQFNALILCGVNIDND